MSYNLDRAPRQTVRKVIAPLASLLLLACSAGLEQQERVTPAQRSFVEVSAPENLRVNLKPVLAPIAPEQQAAYDALGLQYNTQKFNIALESNKRNEALAYINSAERNDLLITVTNSIGLEVATFAQNNKLGNFNFYNSQTGVWSRSAYNQGLGNISHTPGTGGYPGFVGITGIYQNLDGTLDASKDIHDVFLSVQGQPQVSIQQIEYAVPNGTVESGWQVSVIENPWTDHPSTILTDRYQAQTLSVEELRAIDQRAMDVLTTSMASME